MFFVFILLKHIQNCLELKSAVAQIISKLREMDVRLTEVRKSILPMSDGSFKLLPNMPLKQVKDIVAFEQQLAAEPEIAAVLVRFYFFVTNYK